MYHPGKIVKILSPKDRHVESCDKTIQAVCEMWDYNILTFLVNDVISKKLKEGDFVLVDYRPSAINPHAPRHEIIKIVHGRNADVIWNKYRDFLHKQKKSKESTHEYMG